MAVTLTKPTVDGSNGTWGTELNTALDALNGADKFIYKTADQSIASSITPVDDTHLSISLGVGTYIVNGVYFATGAQAGDIRVAWAFSGTAVNSYRGGQGPGANTTDTTAGAAAATTVGVMRGSAAGAGSSTITASAIYGTDAAAQSLIQESALMVVTVAGTLKVQWAQGASSATATVMKTGSYLWARQVA
jgi:hypothetical protein